MNTRSSKTKKLVMYALFTTLIAVGAFIQIPIPVVPFTLQFLFTMLAGLILGGRGGAISVLAYIFIGLIGIPVFTQGGGIGYIFQPTFGYIIGFVVATYVTGKIANKTSSPTLPRLLTANFIGLIILYVFGVAYVWLIKTFYLGVGIALWPLLLNCFLLPVPGDILLCILSALLAKRLIPYMHNHYPEVF